MKPTREQLRELLRAVSATRPEEIDCGEFLMRVAAYLETLDQTQPLPAELEAVSQHLVVCPECNEEFEALMSVHESIRDEHA